MLEQAHSACVIKRTSLNLDTGLVAAARDALGTSGTTDTVHAALREIVRKRRIEWLLQHDFSLTDEEHEELERSSWGD